MKQLHQVAMTVLLVSVPGFCFAQAQVQPIPGFNGLHYPDEPPRMSMST
jgi:hypothetical protein